MKVLYITNIPSPYMVEMFNELGKKCDLTVLYERKDAKDREKSWFQNNDEKNYKSTVLNGINIGVEGAFNPSIIKWLKKDFDIYVTGYCTPTGMLTFEYLRMKKKSFIFNADGGIIKNDNRLRYAIKKHFIGNAPYYLSSGKKTAEYLIHYGATKENIFYYPFTSLKEKDILSKVLTEDEKNIKKTELGVKEKIMVLAVGQFIHRKGFDVLLRACSKLDSCIGVYIIGGEPTDEYNKLKNELNLTNVYFEGFKSKEQLIEYYKASDIFVLPTREDIWGLVINEAMSYGLPVITTENCVAGLELINDYENGFIIPVDDEFQLTNRINEIAQSRVIRERMAENSLRKIELYTIENVAKKHYEAFTQIMEKLKI